MKIIVENLVYLKNEMWAETIILAVFTTDIIIYAEKASVNN